MIVNTGKGQLPIATSLFQIKKITYIRFLLMPSLSSIVYDCISRKYNLSNIVEKLPSWIT